MPVSDSSADTGHYTGTGDATTALMLAWVHILRSERSTQQPGRPDSGEGSAASEGIDGPYSRALQCALATVKVHDRVSVAGSTMLTVSATHSVQAMIQRSQQRAAGMQAEAEGDSCAATR